MNKNLLCSIITISIFIVRLTNAQSSSLVFFGSGGKLEYKTYANTGQTNSVNTIPDFSFAGYKGGGTVLPDVPAVETINPIIGDSKSIIQAAIDRVSSLPLNANGYRGAVLLKSGKYEVNGSLFIRASGVVLRGEGQNTPDKKGTELFAASKTQHDFIQIIGNETSSSSNTETILDTKQFPPARTWQDFNVIKGVAEELEGDKIISFHLTADVNQYVNYSSKEDSLQYRPYLEITTTKTTVPVLLSPSADTYVQGGTSSKINYGSDISIAVKNAGVNGNVTREGYIRFVPGAQRKAVNVADDKLRDRVEAALRAEPRFSNSSIRVKSVNQGVVLLDGKAASLSQHLVALELTDRVDGVRRVASEIESPEQFADQEIWYDETPAGGNGAFTDAWITGKTKLRYMTDADVPAGDINVDTHNGIVTLFGPVPSAAVRQKAQTLALDVGGVKSVNNELIVVSPAAKKSATIADDQIEAAIELRLQEANLVGAAIHVEVKAAVVRLTGTVQRPADHYDAVLIARATEGVLSVRDDLTVVRPAPGL